MIMKKLLTLILAVAALPAFVYAQNNTGSVAVPLLNESPDARSAGMGNTGVATTPDLASQHWNMAKYVFIDGLYGASLSFTPLSVSKNARQAYLTGYYKFQKDQTLSASFWYNTLGSASHTDEQGNVLGEINANEWAFDVAYSMRLGHTWSAGVLFRYINSNIMGSSPDSKTGQAVAGDLGVYHQNDVTIAGRASQYAFGLSVSNIGTKISYSDNADNYYLPMNLRLGGRIGMDIAAKHRLALSLDLNKLLVPSPDSSSAYFDESVLSAMFSSFGDAPDGFSQEIKEISFGAGLEYMYDKMFAVRTGFYTENMYAGSRRYFTLGGGAFYKNFSLDLAYLVNVSGGIQSLPNMFRLTLGFQLSSAKATK